jgi:hypothetical protein
MSDLGFYEVNANLNLLFSFKQRGSTSRNANANLYPFSTPARPIFSLKHPFPSTNLYSETACRPYFSEGVRTPFSLKQAHFPKISPCRAQKKRYVVRTPYHYITTIHIHTIIINTVPQAFFTPSGTKNTPMPFQSKIFIDDFTPERARQMAGQRLLGFTYHFFY